ncbi:MAG: DUF1641 domain-containing protein [Anaerolineae bacterium]|nr:DUF1641 domain-containing protein [Anaerolineae bacterium]
MDTLVINPISAESETIADLNRKIDALTAQVAFLAEEARAQQQARSEWSELKQDMTPIAMDMYRLTVTQLEEIEPHVQLEDILHLFKRLLRNTRNLEQMLDQFESLVELGSDLSPLSQDAFVTMMARLDEMERKGYFTFVAGGMGILDRIVTNYTEDDIEQLGENIVLILDTLKEMTQPELMRLLRSSVIELTEEDSAETPSLFAIMRQLNDPGVRRGLSKTLNVLKTMSDT